MLYRSFCQFADYGNVRTTRAPKWEPVRNYSRHETTPGPRALLFAILVFTKTVELAKRALCVGEEANPLTEIDCMVFYILANCSTYYS
jgi:hypothetical protein